MLLTCLPLCLICFALSTCQVRGFPPSAPSQTIWLAGFTTLYHFNMRKAMHRSWLWLFTGSCFMCMVFTAILQLLVTRGSNSAMSYDVTSSLSSYWKLISQYHHDDCIFDSPYSSLGCSLCSYVIALISSSYHLLSLPRLEMALAIRWRWWATRYYEWSSSCRYVGSEPGLLTFRCVGWQTFKRGC